MKASGAVQSWPQKQPSMPTFSIREASGWIEHPDGSFVEDPEKKRRSDVYVFGHHVGACPDDPEEWEFFVVPTARIDHVCGRQASITLTSISGSLDPGRCRVAGLRAAIFQSASR